MLLSKDVRIWTPSKRYLPTLEQVFFLFSVVQSEGVCVISQNKKKKKLNFSTTDLSCRHEPDTSLRGRAKCPDNKSIFSVC